MKKRDMYKNIKVGNATEELKNLKIEEGFENAIEKIANSLYEENEELIGSKSEKKSVEELLAEEKEGFNDLKDIQAEGMLALLQDTDLRSKLAHLAEGIKDEEKEKKSIEEAGIEQTGITVNDITIQILDFICNELKARYDLIAQEYMYKKNNLLNDVRKREKLVSARSRFINLQAQSESYRGSKGKELNQCLGEAVQDIDEQIDFLINETVDEKGNLLEEDQVDDYLKNLEERVKILGKTLESLKEEKKTLEKSNRSSSENGNPAKNEERVEQGQDPENEPEQPEENQPEEMTEEAFRACETIIANLGEKPISVRDLAKETNMTRVDTKEVLKKLEEMGIVKREGFLKKYKIQSKPEEIDKILKNINIIEPQEIEEEWEEEWEEDFEKYTPAEEDTEPKKGWKEKIKEGFQKMFPPREKTEIYEKTDNLEEKEETDNEPSQRDSFIGSLRVSDDYIGKESTPQSEEEKGKSKTDESKDYAVKEWVDREL